MQQVVLGIKNDMKAKYLLDFLRQLDFVEIKGIRKRENQAGEIVAEENQVETFEDILLNAPVLSKEEIANIEQVGKELNRWQIKECPLFTAKGI